MQRIEKFILIPIHSPLPIPHSLFTTHRSLLTTHHSPLTKKNPASSRVFFSLLQVLHWSRVSAVIQNVVDHLL